MTLRRWATTSLVMLGIAGLLVWAAPTRSALDAALRDPQQLVDTSGPDALLVLLAWTAAAACWLWGATGLLLTVASTRAGITGRLAATVLTVVLPAGARRAAALAVGLTLTTAPVLGATALPGGYPPSLTTPSTVTVTTAADDADHPGWADTGAEPAGSGADRAGEDTASPAPDWPAPGHPTDAGPPDWPAPPGDGEHVVVRGDCLWDIAADRLAAANTGPVDDTAVAAAVHAWWQANAAVIGPDPDLLLPGQVLRPPPAP